MLLPLASLPLAALSPQLLLYANIPLAWMWVACCPSVPVILGSVRAQNLMKFLQELRQAEWRAMEYA